MSEMVIFCLPDLIVKLLLEVNEYLLTDPTVFILFKIFSIVHPPSPRLRTLLDLMNSLGCILPFPISRYD